AQAIDTPPFYCYPLRPGVTFTYLGVKVTKEAAVVMQNDEVCENLFAAGEIMAGNILSQGYCAGFGMSIGSVFGRIAGREAAKSRGEK
ncbi:tricarballylate dehydrogenase, partial [Campylobacter fetus subsp. testudinum]